MIIIDFNQIIIASVIDYIEKSSENLSEGFLRHLSLNSIRLFVNMFKGKYGNEIVLACDNGNYWRKDIFPYYKQGRKKKIKDSKDVWENIFNIINKLKEELKLYSHYKVIEVNKCEADDIISVLSRKFSVNGKILIISEDKDFIQLHKFKNIYQYAPIRKKFLKETNPEGFLKRHIIKGDPDDGIPNILSREDIFLTEGRQKSIFEKKLEVWVHQYPEDFCDSEMKKRYEINEKLIDLTKIPDEIEKDILDVYENTQINSKNSFLNYLIMFKLKNLIPCIGDF